MNTKQLINKKTLRSMVPLSERTIDAMEKRGQFPKRFALSARSVVWDLDEVQEWMERQKAACRQVTAPGHKPVLQAVT